MERPDDPSMQGEALLRALVEEMRRGPDGSGYRLDTVDIELTLVEPTRRVPPDQTGLEVHHQETDGSGGTYTAQGNTDIRITNGEGWRLIAVEPFAGGPSSAVVATSHLGLDRLWNVYELVSSRPELDFEAEMLIALTAVVSGSCPDLIFVGLVITESRVHGEFEAIAGSRICTADGNSVAFLFIADRDVLPTRFELSAERDQLTVDQNDPGSLEAAIWGSGRWEISIEGTPPQAVTYNAMLFDSGVPNALLFSAESWEESMGRPIQGISGDRPTLIEGFVASCDLDQCEECLGTECDLIDRLGEGCSLVVEPVAFGDGTVRVVFEETDCSILIDLNTDNPPVAS